MFQLVIDENRMVVTPKMTLIDGGTMYNVHIEVESLVYIYVYVGSWTIFFPVILRRFKVILGFNSQTRENAF